MQNWRKILATIDFENLLFFYDFHGDIILIYYYISMWFSNTQVNIQQVTVRENYYHKTLRR